MQTNSLCDKHYYQLAGNYSSSAAPGWNRQQHPEMRKPQHKQWVQTAGPSHQQHHQPEHQQPLLNKDIADLQGLLLPPVLELPPHTAHADPMQNMQQAARQLRECIKHRCQHGDNVCTVCGRYLPLVTKGAGKALEQSTWEELPVRQLPNLQLLRADGPKSERMPRHALTTVTIDSVVYCLEPAGINCHPGACKAATPTLKFTQQLHQNVTYNIMNKCGDSTPPYATHERMSYRSLKPHNPMLHY